MFKCAPLLLSECGCQTKKHIAMGYDTQDVKQGIPTCKAPQISDIQLIKKINPMWQNSRQSNAKNQVQADPLDRIFILSRWKPVPFLQIRILSS